MPPTAEISLRSYDSNTAMSILDSVVIPLWEDIYSEIAAEDPFFETKRFIQRYDGYIAAPGFKLCTASDPDNEVLGMAFGYSLQPGGRWWAGLQSPVSKEFTEEDGRRTFAINEIMVLGPVRRRGIATALHRDLLAGRTESRATLLVEPDNIPARSAYLHWGWTSVGMLKPFPDSPLYESMVISLPLEE